MAEELFKFPFVDGVFLAANFVTVTKTDNVSWDFITMQLREFIRDWISDCKEILYKAKRLLLLILRILFRFQSLRPVNMTIK